MRGRARIPLLLDFVGEEAEAHANACMGFQIRGGARGWSGEFNLSADGSAAAGLAAVAVASRCVLRLWLLWKSFLVQRAPGLGPQSFRALFGRCKPRAMMARTIENAMHCQPWRRFRPSFVSSFFSGRKKRCKRAYNCRFYVPKPRWYCFVATEIDLRAVGTFSGSSAHVTGRQLQRHRPDVDMKDSQLLLDPLAETANVSVLLLPSTGLYLILYQDYFQS
jgi:hypothetical protein